ncbi:MAG: hypothetical protein IKK42_09030 [Oscillospiraceae bacterium]|nr:hypothetical protein [Oscillospiraceae bacterium]
MKKFLAAIISLAMCASMLTACGKDTETAEVSDVTTTASETLAETEAATTEATEAATTEATEAETTEAETEATTEETTVAETEAETEAETKAEAKAASYSSLADFAKSGDAYKLDTKDIPAEDSLTYDWIRIFEGATGIYMDAEYVDGSVAVVMGMKQDNMYMYMYEAASNTNMTIILIDGKMYMLDEATKTGYSMTADASLMEEYDVEAMLGDIDFDAETANAEDVKTTKIEIGGEEYTLEIAETQGVFLFDKNDEIVAILAEENGTVNALKINEFSGDAPDKLFKAPTGYEIVDLDSVQ